MERSGDSSTTEQEEVGTAQQPNRKKMNTCKLIQCNRKNNLTAMFQLLLESCNQETSG